MGRPRKPIYGVGINDATYSVATGGKGKPYWTCPIYDCWRGLLKRCYSEKFLETHPAYIGTTVCDEWLLFSNFEKWVRPRFKKGFVIDKDILNPSKVYSPDTCLMVDKRTNGFVVGAVRNANELPFGVSENPDYKTNRYRVDISIDNKAVWLGDTDNLITAEIMWLEAKISRCEHFINLQDTEENVRGLRKYQSTLINRLEELN